MKMKKLLLILLPIVMLLSSCSFGGLGVNKSSFFQDDRTMANDTLEKVLIAIQNKDTATLKSLFSVEAFKDEDDFNTKANDLFEFYQGDFVSYDDWGGAVGGEGLREDGKEWYAIQPTYDVKTSEQEYRIAFKEFTVNEFEPNKVGIWSLYIIKKSDDIDQNCAYRGDGKWTPGINIMGNTKE